MHANERKRACNAQIVIFVVVVLVLVDAASIGSMMPVVCLVFGHRNSDFLLFGCLDIRRALFEREEKNTRLNRRLL